MIAAMLPLLVALYTDRQPQKLVGRGNWWAPGPLARWHTRWGFTESDSFTPEADEDRTPIAAR